MKKKDDRENGNSSECSNFGQRIREKTPSSNCNDCSAIRSRFEIEVLQSKFLIQSICSIRLHDSVSAGLL